MGTPASPGVDTPHWSSGNFAAVTPSDSVDLSAETIYLLVGVAGNINCHNRLGTAVVVPATAGINHIRTTRVLAASTTATGIVAFYAK